MSNREFDQTRIPSEAEQKWLDSDEGKALMAAIVIRDPKTVDAPFVPLMSVSDPATTPERSNKMNHTVTVTRITNDPNPEVNTDDAGNPSLEQIEEAICRGWYGNLFRTSTASAAVLVLLSRETGDIGERKNMKYKVEVWDGEASEWKSVYSTDWALRVTSNQFGEHVVFETDDPEYNG